MTRRDSDIPLMTSVVVSILEPNDDGRLVPDVIGIYSGMLAADRALDELIEKGQLAPDREVWMHQVRHLRDGRVTVGTVHSTLSERSRI